MAAIPPIRPFSGSRFHRQAGAFTVLEIIVVIAIIFLLMLLLVGAYIQHTRKIPVEELAPAEPERLIDPINPFPATPPPQPSTPRAIPALRGTIPNPPPAAASSTPVPLPAPH